MSAIGSRPDAGRHLTNFMRCSVADGPISRGLRSTISGAVKGRYEHQEPRSYLGR